MKQETKIMKAVELFAGAGGLAMGVSLAGFESLAVVEWDKWACDTIRENQRRDYPLVRDWPLWNGDVRDFDWSAISECVDLVAGGPPCQPFSMGGRHKAFGDKRDMFPATVDIVRCLCPKAFIIENVKGLTRSSFSNYFQYILLQLEFPEIARRGNETWLDHLKRLQGVKTSGGGHLQGLTYHVIPTLVNAADYGVPQKRERVFLVGFRSDLGVEWSFPRPTHSLDALLVSQWITGDYWERHEIAKRNRPDIPARLEKRVARLASCLFPPGEKPWRTVRDALWDLPDPRLCTPDNFMNHHFQDGARAYPGHTGSPLDLPAKTLKAGDHGVPGGENMMVRDDGGVRYFTVRESARLQTFPDGYIFHGSWTEIMRQLGNAVPVALARIVAASVAEQLAETAIRARMLEQRRERIKA
ncbi:DNA (cytosine-5)-methyltransferase 1 [Ectothiorhodospira magna]|uniref:DNA (cytosine-5-)-methyltransferase n=1 Tax=Ectothiorhodospira magna TaxID=867345 RepID=A0A1H8ZXC7_9GAMM|nr:DNA cytosine methyltransferase [Ectothiorhodospira magna]SEP68913.1 DNA (cytosine-5)-methyltransferase 1 [Ectothiorhodospira magna]